MVSFPRKDELYPVIKKLILQRRKEKRVLKNEEYLGHIAATFKLDLRIVKLQKKRLISLRKAIMMRGFFQKEQNTKKEQSGKKYDGVSSSKSSSTEGEADTISIRNKNIEQKSKRTNQIQRKTKSTKFVEDLGSSGDQYASRRGRSRTLRSSTRRHRSKSTSSSTGATSSITSKPKPKKQRRSVPPKKKTVPRISPNPKARVTNYSSLLALKPATTENFYGVIIDCTYPSKCQNRSSVNYISITITDPSLKGLDDDSLLQRKMVINIFNSNMELLPQILFTCGDVIRLHRCPISVYRNGRKQGLPLNKITGITVLDAKDCRVKYNSATKEFSFGPDDYSKVRELYEWTQRILFNDPFFLRNQYRQHLENFIPSDGVFDLLCRVQAVATIRDSKKKAVDYLLLVWDGTSNDAEEEDISDEFPENAIVLIRQSGTPVLGVVRLVRVSGPCEGVLSLVLGDWVKLRNISSTDTDPLIIQRSSKGGMIKIPSDVIEVRDKMQGFRLIRRRGRQRNKSGSSIDSTATLAANSNVLSSVDDPSLPFWSLSDLKQCNRVPFRARVAVTCVSYRPKNISKIIWKNEAQNKFYYAMKLKLRDSSGEITALLINDKADKFFIGIPSCDLSCNPVMKQSLEQRLEKLTSGVRFDCCISSYYPQKMLDDLKSGKISSLTPADASFIIFDTTFFGDSFI